MVLDIKEALSTGAGHFLAYRENVSAFIIPISSAAFVNARKEPRISVLIIPHFVLDSYHCESLILSKVPRNPLPVGEYEAESRAAPSIRRKTNAEQGSLNPCPAFP